MIEIFELSMMSNTCRVSRKHAPLVFVHAYFQTVLYFIPRCIKDKDNDQRANRAEIKTQICMLKYQS